MQRTKAVKLPRWREKSKNRAEPRIARMTQIHLCNPRNLRLLRCSCDNLHNELSTSRRDDMPYKLTVNGKSTTVDVPGDMPRLCVIRYVLNLKATKFGCGIGQCGACTVHLNGRPVRSCSTPVSNAASVPITTLEGLSVDGSHPVQRAWQEVDVPQCGYCQAGQMMSAAALL